jgi:hypothetical protein
MIDRRISGFSLAVVTLALLTGCGAMPYQPAANETMVPIKLMGIGEPRMCKDGKVYSLSKDSKTGVAKVPVGQRISVGSYMYFDNYSVVYSCTAWLSFVPEADRAYVSNAGIGDQRCFIEVVREDTAKETGVVREPSVASSNCFKPAP